MIRSFQRKCIHELFEKRHDRALLLATHSEHFVREFCDRALVLNNGQATVYDDVNKAISVYEAL